MWRGGLEKLGKVRVFISGITGFVGSHLADYLLSLDQNIKISGTKRWRSSLDNITHILDHITLHDCDLRDLSSLISVLKQVEPDKIFHLAAQSFVPYSYAVPIETLETNVIGTANLLEAIRILEQDPMIHICSSSEVYGQVKTGDVPIRESQPFNPASPYAVSKVAEDMLGLQYYTAYGLKTVRTRMFTHTGARQNEGLVCSDFTKQIIRIKKGLQSPVIKVGNLDSIRTFCDVRDCVKAYWILNDFMAGEVFNIGGNTTMTVGEMLNRLIKLSSVKVTIEVDNSRLRPADVTLQIPDCSKFQNLTGWKPEIPLEKTLSDLLSYWENKI